MKHIFGIASNLAFYVAHKIITLDDLDPDECIFILLRNYSISKEYATLYRNQIHTSYNNDVGQGRIFAGWRVIRTYKNIREFDKLVDQYIQDNPFVWYTQVCSNDICSMMVTKINCTKYYVIEDGASAYKATNDATFRGWKYLLYQYLLKPLFPRIYEVKNHNVEMNHPKFAGCIGVSNQSFPYAVDKRVIGIPFFPAYLPQKPDAIISIDALYYYFTELETKQIVQIFAQTMKKAGYSTVAYKHHPYVLAESNRSIFEYYESLIHQYFSIPLIELKATDCIENLLVAYKCDFYTVFSSIAIYAHEIGCKCYSPITRFMNNSIRSIPLIEKICIPL